MTAPSTTPGSFSLASGVAAVTSAAQRARRGLRTASAVDVTAAALTAVMFALLFAKPMRLLADAWWTDPNSGHGLLLAPLALWLAWRAGRHPDVRARRAVGAGLLVIAVLARYAADLAAELFVMRGSMVLALVGVVVWYAGMRQLRHWWLPFTLMALSIPIPEVVLNSVALPLQFTASRIGAALLEARHIPVLLTGNVIRVPGQELFVAEACSGLRSLTALISLGVLLGALFLDRWPSRALLLLLTVPIAILINGVRVFLTGFLVVVVSPELGQGFMHTSEGMVMFGGAFAIIALLAWGLSLIERSLRTQSATAGADA